MIHLLQLYKMIEDKKLFVGVFNDFFHECQDLGYAGGFEDELFNEMLLNHFGLEIECSKQLNRITNSVLKNSDLNILNNFVK